MNSILDMLGQQMGGNTVHQIGKQLGVDDQRASAAIAAALPLLLGALARNASKPDGAQALSGALARDHDGSILDDLSGFLPNASNGPGASILRHVLGDRQNTVQTNLGRATGLDSAKAAMLLAALAPVVLGALGRMQRQKNLTAGTLASTLDGETRELQQRAGAGASLITSMLDADGDGSIADDVAQKGLGMLGKFLRR